jgi:hypothetical protein
MLIETLKILIQRFTNLNLVKPIVLVFFDFLISKFSETNCISLFLTFSNLNLVKPIDKGIVNRAR